MSYVLFHGAERAKGLLLLLETLNDYLPSVKTSTGAIVARSARSGFGAVEKQECPTCKGCRRQRGLQPCAKCMVGDKSEHRCSRCPTCFDAERGCSRGYVFVDPYDRQREPVLTERGRGPTSLSSEAGAVSNGGLDVPRSVSTDELREARRREARVEKDLRRLGSQPLAPYEWELNRRRRDLYGSYRELDRALERLRILDGGYGSRMVLRVYAWGDPPPRGPGRVYLDESVNLLMGWLPDPLRVPQYLVDDARGSAREETVVELRARGLSLNKIAVKLGTTREKVKRALARAA